MRPDRSAVLAGLIAAALALAANLPWIGRGELESEEARRVLPTASFLERLDEARGGGAPESDGPDADGALATWAVPRIFGRAYLAKPPGFYWWTALHQVTLERSGLDGALRPAAWPPSRRAGPTSVRFAALSSAALLAAFVAALAAAAHGRRLATEVAATIDVSSGASAGLAFSPLGLGVAAGAMTVAAPALLAKAPLGEIETTFALTCALAAFALLRAALRPGVPIAAAATLLLGLACLTKGPLALLFAAAPALTCAGARLGLRTAVLRLAAPLLVGTALFLAWAFFVRAAVEATDAPAAARASQDVAASWAAELWRGGTGGAVVYLKDRWRLLTGVLGGWAPASLLALGLFVGLRREAWRREPGTHLALHAVLWGLAILLLWPGVRPRYALPLLPFVVLLATHRLANGGFPRAPRLVAGVLATAAAAIGPVAWWLVERAKAATGDGFARSEVAPVSGLEWAAIVASATLGLVVLVRLRHLAPRGLLVASLLCLVAGRAVQLGPIERTRTPGLRAPAAAHLEAVCRGLGRERLHLDVWTYFNDLAYTALDVRWCTDPGGLPAGALVLSRGMDPEREASAAWEQIPLFEGADWSFAPLPPRAFGRDGSDGGARLWRRTASDAAGSDAR